MLAVTPGRLHSINSVFLTVQPHADPALSQWSPVYTRAALLLGRVMLGPYQSLEQAGLAQQLPSPDTKSTVQGRSSREGQVRTAGADSFVSYK